MSILKLRTNLVEKIKCFGNNFYPVLKKPLEESRLPTKNISGPISKVLSVDASKICQKINVNHLEKLGCEVESVHFARSALDKLSVPFQVILLDVNLPDCSIDLLINLIRCDMGNVNQKTPIVLTSSWLNKSCKKIYLDLGVNEIYIKPIQKKDFKRILQNYGVIT